MEKILKSWLREKWDGGVWGSFQRWRLAKDSIADGDVKQPRHPWPARTSPTLSVYVPCDGQEKFSFTEKKKAKLTEIKPANSHLKSCLECPGQTFISKNMRKTGYIQQVKDKRRILAVDFNSKYR